MRKPNRFSVVLFLGVLAGCQAGTPAPTPSTPTMGPSAQLPGPSPTGGTPVASPALSPSPSASPVPSLAPSPAPSPSATAPVVREVVLGSIYNEEGSSVENAQIQVVSDDPAFNRTVSATGGAFGIRDVPVGTLLTITATAPGFSSRTRAIRVAQVIPYSADDPNRLEFGGDGEGAMYYLSERPEIYRTEPANLATGVSGGVVEVVFHLSRPLDLKNQGLFDSLVRVHPPLVGSEGWLTIHSAVGRAHATMQWDEDGRRAVFRFGLPFVARDSGAAVVVDLDPNAPIENWPKDDNGRRLGFDVVFETRDGGGATARNRIAPFARTVMQDPMPSPRPSPIDLWGLTHFVSIRYELARDLTPLKVTKVQPLPGGGSEDAFAITFSKPVFGYPASALDAAEIRKPSNYRFVVGRTTERDEREAFEAADPSVQGSSPSQGVEFDENDPYTIVIKTSSGKFDGVTRYKLYVGPAVADIYGVGLGAAGYLTEGVL